MGEASVKCSQCGGILPMVGAIGRSHKEQADIELEVERKMFEEEFKAAGESNDE